MCRPPSASGAPPKRSADKRPMFELFCLKGFGSRQRGCVRMQSWRPPETAKPENPLPASVQPFPGPQCVTLNLRLVCDARCDGTEKYRQGVTWHSPCKAQKHPHNLTAQHGAQNVQPVFSFPALTPHACVICRWACLFVGF